MDGDVKTTRLVLTNSHQKAEPVPAPKSSTLAGENPGSLLLTWNKDQYQKENSDFPMNLVINMKKIQVRKESCKRK